MTQYENCFQRDFEPRQTPDDFVTNAVRTESRIDSVVVNKQLLTHVIQAIVQLSEVLDQIKKNVFYKKPMNVIAIRDALASAKEHCISTDYLNIGGPTNNETTLAVNPRLFHCIIGLATETDELLEAMNLDSPDFDRVNILEELGDQAWYQAIGIDTLEASFEKDVLDRVISKLRARYPNKFNSEQAINRDLVKEREVLEGNKQNP